MRREPGSYREVWIFLRFPSPPVTGQIPTKSEGLHLEVGYRFQVVQKSYPKRVHDSPYPRCVSCGFCLVDDPIADQNLTSRSASAQV